MRRPRLPRSFRQQIVVLTASVTAFAMVLLTVVLQLALAAISRRDVDRVLEDRADAVIGSLDGGGGELDVPDSRLDAGVAVYDASGRVVAGGAPQSLRATYADLRTTSTLALRTVSDDNRIQATPFRTPDGRSGVVIVTEHLGPYEEAERLALIVSLVTGLLTTAAAAAVAAWATHRALRPVTEMARTATEWSEHDLGRRFSAGPPDNEISALAGTLDTLLDRVSSAIRSEQRLTSELAHELRTPLTTIQGMADLVLLRDRIPEEARADLAEISAASQRMATTITTLLELARNEASMLEASQCSLADVADEVREGASAGAALRLDLGDTRLALPHALAVRALAPLVENALRYADTTVTVTSRPGAQGSVEVLVDDDGPGIDVGTAQSIFEPGASGGTGTGAGLGLAISRRVARSAGGEVVLEPGAPTSGARFVLRLPLA